MNASTSQGPILILRFSALGDVAMTIPVIYSIAEANPERQFIVATTPFFSRLFINCPPNVSIFPIAIKDVRGFGAWRKLLHDLSRLGPSGVADLHNVSRSWAIDAWFKLHRIPVKMVDKKRALRKRALREKTPQESFVSRYLNVFKELGLRIPDYKIPEAGCQYAPALPFKKLDLSEISVPIELDRPAVGIAPIARYLTKSLPEEELIGIIRELTSEGRHVYLFGGRGEEAVFLERCASQFKGCTSLAGRFPIEEELRIMADLDAMISMDSANQHLASLAGTRVVTIWGGTSPLCGFSPYGQKPSDSICKGLSCQPCSVAGTPECPLRTMACMKAIELPVKEKKAL